eukprot:scaffold1231_cov187-Pinguiococcus_pyrenoidosus.AAC.8
MSRSFAYTTSLHPAGAWAGGGRPRIPLDARSPAGDRSAEHQQRRSEPPGGSSASGPRGLSAAVPLELALGGPVAFGGGVQPLAAHVVAQRASRGLAAGSVGVVPQLADRAGHPRGLPGQERLLLRTDAAEQ